MRYDTAIAQHLRKKGHNVLITTRTHPDTIPLAKHLNEDTKIIGRYGGKSLKYKLLNSVRREERFINMFDYDGKPDVAISHGSPDQCRVAFGLNIPIICTWDSPHAKKVEKLTLPLADHIVSSIALQGYFHNTDYEEKISYFDGVDEVAWLYQARKISSAPWRPLIVYRDFERTASYARGNIYDNGIINKLSKFGDVLRFTRFPNNFCDALSHLSNADLMVGYGGTMCREACLMGIPTIILKTKVIDQSVNEYLAEKGFPIYFSNNEDFIKVLCKHKRQNVSDKLAKLENPIDIIENIVNKYEKEMN